MPAAARSAGAPSSTVPLACASWWPCWPALAPGRPRSSGPTARSRRPARRGVTVVVISPNQVKNLRGRYGSAGNKDDRLDAFVLADTLRTDRARLRPLTPDSPATVALRRACRARKDLVSHRVAVANQLRAHLRNVFPGAAGLFSELDSPVSLAFLARVGTQDRADWLTPARLGKWLASVGYSGRTDPAVLHARLTAAPAASPAPTRRPGPHHPRAARRPGHPHRADQGPVHPDQQPAASWPRTPTAMSSPRCPAPAPSAPHGSSPRSATAGPASPPQSPSPASPAPHPPRGSPARSAPSLSGGPATSNSATPSPTSPATPATPAPGPPTSTSEPAPGATTTPTLSASSPAPGCS